MNKSREALVARLDVFFILNLARRRALEENELASKNEKSKGMNANGLVQANGHIYEEEKQNLVFLSIVQVSLCRSV